MSDPLSLAPSKTEHVFDSSRWALTTGILTGVTLVAFENLAVVTIAPGIAEALAGQELYGWIFSGFLLASLLGVVLGGSEADRCGPARPFAFGFGLFGLGLLAAGFAPDMLLLIAGRVVQGLGGGLMLTAMYATVNLAYPDSLRPRIVALMSSAWVVPALLGPALAGLLAETLGWRVVFWGLTPLLALVAFLTLGVMKGLEPAGESAPSGRLRLAALLVLGAGMFLVGLSLRAPVPMVLLVVAGAAMAFAGLRRLLPAGALRFRPGLPAVVAARGLFYAAFVGVETFLALMLTGVHGFPAPVVGVAIASGAISWTLGSWGQERLERRYGPSRRPRHVLFGTLLLSIGLAVQVLALYSPNAPLAVTVLGWMLAGFGIGLAHATSSVLAFAYAPSGEEGAVSSALQLADQFTSALSTGVGGALFALAVGLGGETREGVLLAFGFNLLLVALSVLAASRIGRG